MHEHLSDRELARYATDPASVPAARRRVIEQAAAGCAICRTSLDFFSVVSLEELGDIAVWEPDADWRSPDDPITAYLRRIAEEDRQADELIDEKKLFASPMRTAWRDLSRDRRLMTGGVVRRLSAHANTIYQNEPLDALTFADAAISVAEALPDDAYPWNAVFELRGTAWKERANALMVYGNYPAALEALTHAERAYQHLPLPEFALSTVALVRASLAYEQGRLDEAEAFAKKAEQGFVQGGHEERRIRALFLRGSICFEARNVGRAVSMFRQVLEYGEATNDSRWLARGAYAIGNCEIESGNPAEATVHFARALAIFREIGPEWDRLATEWGLARVILHGGQPREAVRRLRHVASGYERRSMLSDGALVWLDIVETLVALGETKEVAYISARLFEIFKEAGMMTGALTALAYMKQAAAAGKLTASTVDAVRTYLRRARRQPELVFKPPLDSFR